MVEQLKAFLESVSSYAELAAIVDEAKEGVTFFGHRYVYLDDYEGTLPLTSLALGVMGLLAKNEGHFQDQEEREIFDGIVNKIDLIFEQNFARKGNLITRICCIFRDFWISTRLFDDDIYFFWLMDVSPLREDYSNNYLTLKYFSKLTQEIQPAWSEITSFSDLLPFADTARDGISVFGYRYIHFLDYRGNLPINELAKRTMELAKSTLEFTQDKDYQKIVHWVDKNYLDNEATFEWQGLFTRTCCTLRDAWNQRNGESFEQSRAVWEQFKNESAEMSG